LIDSLAEALAARPYGQLDLLRLRPESVELETVEDQLVAHLVDAGAIPSHQYMAWPVYDLLWSATPATDPEVAGPPAAVYCWGVLAWHILTGSAFIAAPDLFSLAMRHLATPSPAEIPPPDVPTALSAILRKALARERQDRFQTLQEVGRALATVHLPPSRGTPAYALCSDSTGRAHMLPEFRHQAEGEHIVRIGRNDPYHGHTVDLDLADEPGGRGVHRSQAIVRLNRSGCTVEDWLDERRPRGARGRPTRVNGRALQPGLRHPLEKDDQVAFGPVSMHLDHISRQEEFP
jgi:hypothetical protein